MAEYTLRQLEYFVAVAEAGSITRAATKVHLSQSAMSTAITDLEAALGVQLVMRHHAKGVTLTPAGAEVLLAGRQLLAAAAELRDVAHGLGSSVSGTLEIGCFEVVAPYLLPALLARAAVELPDLQLRPAEVDLADLVDGVAAGRFELGIGYDLVADARLTTTPLFTLPPYVLVGGSHALAAASSVTLAELADEPMALLDLPHSRDYFRKVFDAVGVVPRVDYRSTSVETCRALVGRGLAYTVLNLHSAVPMSLDGYPLAAIEVSDAVPGLAVVLMSPANATMTRRADAVAQLCRDLFVGEPGQVSVGGRRLPG